jgi:hypothetical protein
MVRAASGHRPWKNTDGERGAAVPVKKPQLEGDKDWEISDSAKKFDMTRAVLGKFELTKLDPKQCCCNAVISMFINSLKFQLLRLARVIDVARSQKQFVTLDRVNAMYDWIEELQDKRFVPILACLRDDVLPGLGQMSVVGEDSCLYIETRDRTFADILERLSSIIATSNAITPRLPAGERLYVLIYRYTQFEAALLEVLNAVEKLSNSKRKPLRAVEKEILLLERYLFDVLSYTAGTLPVEGGGVRYDEEAAQNMRGVMTAWMDEEEIRDMRSRIGIRFFNRRRGKELREARMDYSASKEGRFVQEFVASLESDVKEKQGKGERVNEELSRMLNQMHCMRLMEQVNGLDMDLDGLTLEDPSGEVVSDDDENGEVTLYFANVFQPSPTASQAASSIETDYEPTPAKVS